MENEFAGSNLVGTGKHPRSLNKLARFKVSGTIDRTEFVVGNMPAFFAGTNAKLRASGEFVIP